MSFGLVFKRLAEAEIAEAFAWYDQRGIDQGRAFLAELERVERFVKLNPLLYPKVEGDIRRANLRRPDIKCSTWSTATSLPAVVLSSTPGSAGRTRPGRWRQALTSGHD